jgi:replicative DNA helicase
MPDTFTEPDPFLGADATPGNTPGLMRPVRKGSPSIEEKLANVNRSLPFSDEAEKGVLSCLLQDPAERIPECRQKLPIESFYHTANRLVYELLLKFSDTGKPLDIVTFTQALREQEKLDKVGGAAAISELYTFTPVASHYPVYVKQVMDKWLMRRQIGLGTDIIHAAYEHGREQFDQDVLPVISNTLDSAFALYSAAQDQAQGGSRCQVLDSATMCDEWVDAFEQIVNSRGRIRGAATGVPDVDRVYGGLAPDEDGDFLLTAAYPGQGKTVDFVSKIEEWAIHQKIPTLVFPAEMGRKGIMHRLVLGRAKVNVNVSRSGFIAKSDPGKITQAVREIAEAPLYWDYHSYPEIADIRAAAQIHLRKHGRPKGEYPRLIIAIDHFGHIRPSTKAGKNDRVVGQIEVLQGLHELRFLGILIQLCAQLDKAGREGQSAKKPPGEANLKGASELVEVPTQIEFIHRPVTIESWNSKSMLADDCKRQNDWAALVHHYRVDMPEAFCKPSECPENMSSEQVDWMQHTRKIITKNRHGPTTDEICLRFIPEYQRFVGRTMNLYSNNKTFQQVKFPGF